MYIATANVVLPTTIIGSLPRPGWYTQNLGRREFREAMVDRSYREQYLDAVSTYLRDQEVAGLDVVTDGDCRFDADVEACAYFCCLQAIQNVLRHAGNAQSRVRLELDGDELAFEISDEGPGFDVAHTSRGMGLQIIQDRVDALEGSLTVTSGASGTTVMVAVRASDRSMAGSAR
jgi:signal transduction histidine kinase